MEFRILSFIFQYHIHYFLTIKGYAEKERFKLIVQLFEVVEYGEMGYN